MTEAENLNLATNILSVVVFTQAIGALIFYPRYVVRLAAREQAAVRALLLFTIVTMSTGFLLRPLSDLGLIDQTARDVLAFSIRVTACMLMGATAWTVARWAYDGS